MEDQRFDILKVELSDGIERHYIDSWGNLFSIITQRLEYHKKAFNSEPELDFSNLIIAIDGFDSDNGFNIEMLLSNITEIGDIIKKSSKGKPYQIKYKVCFDNSIIYKLDFQNTHYFKKVSFINTKFVSYASFRNSIFDEEITLKSIKYINKLIDKDCEALKVLPQLPSMWQLKGFDVYIYLGLKYKIDLSNTIFNDNIYFGSLVKSLHQSRFNILSNIILDDSHFNKKMKISSVKLGCLSMQNCRFNDTVSITYNHYDKKSKLDFSFSTINSLFFIDSDLGLRKGKIIKLSDEISFYKSLITKDAFIFFRNINNNNDKAIRQGSLNFQYANILGTITIQDSKLREIKLAKSTLIGDINIENVDTEYDCRESIAKVKDSYLKRNDIVNSLTYKAKEMAYYSDSLSEYFSCKNFKKIISESFTSILTYLKSLKFHHIIVSPFVILFKYLILPFILLPLGILLSIIPIKPVEKIREYTLLYLNRISNSFGMSWGRGVFFTCVTACAFFILINTVGIKSSPLFVWGWNGWDGFGDVWKYYLNMFYLLDFKEKFKDILTGESIKLNALGDTLFFVSKIFVSYGIYQTISAFRKYGK